MRLRPKLIFILAFPAAVLVASAILFYNYAEELRIHVLQPIIEAYFIGRYYLDFVPQLILWMIPLLFVAVIMARRFVRWSRQDRSSHPGRTQILAPGEGELAQLSRQIQRARHSRFARVRLSRTLVEIGARLIAGKAGSTLGHARRQLAEGYWRNVDTVHRFLTPRKHYTSRQSGHDFEHSLQETVEHLEEFDQHV